MPFESQSQRRWMYANEPEMAKRWEKHTPKGKKLPDRKKDEDEEKAAEESPLQSLLRAKAYSDARNYAAKQALMRKLIRERQEEFEIDSDKDGIVGLTHGPTGFRMHLPKSALTGFDLATQNRGLQEEAYQALKVGFSKCAEDDTPKRKFGLLDSLSLGAGAGALGLGAYLWKPARRAMASGLYAARMKGLRGAARDNAARETVRNYVGAAQESGKNRLTNFFLKLDSKLNPSKAQHHSSFAESPRSAMGKWLEEAGAWGKAPKNESFRAKAQGIMDRMWGKNESLDSILSDPNHMSMWRRLVAEKRDAPIAFGAMGLASPALMGLGAAGVSVPAIRHREDIAGLFRKKDD